MTLILTL